MGKKCQNVCRLWDPSVRRHLYLLLHLSVGPPFYLRYIEIIGNKLYTLGKGNVVLDLFVTSIIFTYFY